MKSFRFYSDAGHGWLAVKRSLLIDLGIIGDITGCSYQKGDTVYLEEDKDMTTFIKVFIARYNRSPDILDAELYESGIQSSHSPIRNYNHFTLNDGERFNPW